MPRRKTPETMEELNAARDFAGEKKRKGRGCLFTLLAGIILLLVVLYGFILVQQRLLDLEAEAYLHAVQTATARAGQPAPDFPSDAALPEKQLQETSLDSADAARTATIAVQLTSVADFLLTLTPQP